MDKLVLKGLKYRGLHGYFKEERVTGNDFEVDLAFFFSLQKAGSSDDLSKTIDYSIAQEIVSNILTGESQHLIERLTYLIGEKLFEIFPDATKIEVSVRKMNPPLSIDSDYSEITMSWPR